MGLKQKLHPFMGENGETYMLVACHMISNADKTHFLKVIKDVRVSNRYASNIFRCVRLKKRTIVGLTTSTYCVAWILAKQRG
jgi:hypothetical protein